MVALRAALVVVYHHPLADAGFLLRYAGTDGGHHAAGLVAGNHRVGVLREACGLAGLAFGATVLVQVTAAHSRCLHFYHDFVRSGRWIGELHELQLPPTGKYDTTHGPLPPSIDLMLARRLRRGEQQREGTMHMRLGD